VWDWSSVLVFSGLFFFFFFSKALYLNVRMALLIDQGIRN